MQTFAKGMAKNYNFRTRAKCKKIRESLDNSIQVSQISQNCFKPFLQLT